MSWEMWPEVVLKHFIHQKNIFWGSKKSIWDPTSTPSDGPPHRFKSINLVQKQQKNNFKNINGLEENGQKQSKTL